MARVPARSGVIVDRKRVKKCTTKGCRRERGDERENLVRCAKEGLQEEGGVEGKKFVVGERERERAKGNGERRRGLMTRNQRRNGQGGDGIMGLLNSAVNKKYGDARAQVRAGGWKNTVRYYKYVLRWYGTTVVYLWRISYVFPV